MTPACQPSPASTYAGASACAVRSASAANRILVSVSWRSRFSRSSSSAISAARPASPVRRSSRAASARWSRPAALIRGDSRNPSVCASIAPGSTRATLMRARRPALRVRESCRSPSRTSRRFSPTSGTTSATVASATRSRSSSSGAGSAPARRKSASASFIATPLAHSSAQGYPDTAGCTIGQAGRRSAGRWWSVTTTSIPCARASSTSAAAVMPQSAVISNPVPRAASRSTVAGDRP